MPSVKVESRWIIITITLSMMLGLAATAAAAVDVGDRPEINFKTTRGKLVTAKALQGRIVIFDFWATWCGPCVSSMPHMIEIYHKYKDQGVGIIGISLDTDRARLDQYLKKNKKVAWPQYLDNRETSVAAQWGVRGIPTIFILSPDGEVLWRGHPSQLDTALEEALKSHPPRSEEKEEEKEELDPAVREAAIAMAEAARQAIDNNDFARVVELLSQIPLEAAGDELVQNHIRSLAKGLKSRIADLPLLQAALLSNPQAAKKFKQLLAATKRAQGANNSQADEQERRVIPPALIKLKFRQAEAAREQENHHRAYKLYQWLIKHAPDSEQAAAAGEHISEYEADEQFMAEVKHREAEKQARGLISLARNLQAAGKIGAAQEAYTKILTDHPDMQKYCAQATEALALLEKVQPQTNASE